MDADLKTLEEKISKLINLCTTLREENIALRGDLSHTNKGVDELKAKMLQASNKLESLLANMPESADAVNLESFGLESQ